MGCKLLEIMADGFYAVFHRFEAFLKKGWRTSSDCWMSIQRPSCFFNLCSSCSSRSNKRRSCLLLLPPMAGCAAAQASPPDRTPIGGLAIPLLTHTYCYSPATTEEPVNPHTVVLPSVWETTAESSLPLCRPLPRSRRHPPTWCSPRGVVNMVKERLPSEEYCTWRGWELGPRPQPSFFVICQVSRFVRPAGLQIFQDEKSFHSAGRENGPSVMRNGMYIF